MPTERLSHFFVEQPQDSRKQTNTNIPDKKREQAEDNSGEYPNTPSREVLIGFRLPQRQKGKKAHAHERNIRQGKGNMFD